MTASACPKCGGARYSEAYDPAELAAERVYTETDDADPTNATDELVELGKRLLGITRGQRIAE